MRTFDGMSDADMLARILDAEAAQEGVGGKLAVAAVIQNRAKVGGYGQGIRGVITKPGQFSAINDVTGYAGGKGANQIFWRKPSEESQQIAQAVLAGNYEDPTGGATHYFNPDHADPKWAKGKQWQRIGNHVFGNADAGRVQGGAGNDTLVGQGEAPKGGYFSQWRQRQAKTEGKATAPVSETQGGYFSQWRARQKTGIPEPEGDTGTPVGGEGFFGEPTTDGDQSFLGGVLDSFTGGLTFGFGDEITALEKAVFFGTESEGFWEEYDRFLDAERSQNKRFASENPVTDVAAKAGGAVSGVLAAGPAALARVPAAATTTGKVGQAAAGGAVAGAVAGFGEGEGGAGNRALNATGGAALGAVGGVVGREVGIAASRALGPLWRRGAAFVNGRLTQQAQSALEKAGIDPKLITQDVVQAFEARAIQSGQGADTARRAAADEFGIPLSKGQATDDFNEIAFEEAARSGARGQGAQRISRTADETQQEAIDTALETQVQGASSTAEEGAERVVSGLQRARGEAKAGVNAAYAAVPDDTVIAREAADGLRERVLPVLDDKMVTFAPTAQARGALKQIDKLSRRIVERPDAIGVNIKAVEDFRKSLNQIRGAAGTPQEAREIGAIIKEFDGWLDDTVHRNLIEGAPEALTALKAARKKHSAFKTMFTEGGASGDVGKVMQKLTDPDFNPDGLTAHEMANWMIGSTKAGMKGISARLARRTKDILGESSPEFQELRRAAWARVSQGHRASQKPGAQAVSSDITDFIDGQGKALAAQLFSREERAQMRRLANVIRMTVPPRRATNPSGTAGALARTVQDAQNAVTTAVGVGTGNIGAAFGMRLMQGAMKAVGGARRAAQNFNPSGVRRSSPGGVVAGGVAGQEGSQRAIDQFGR